MKFHSMEYQSCWIKISARGLEVWTCSVLFFLLEGIFNRLHMYVQYKIGNDLQIWAQSSISSHPHNHYANLLSYWRYTLNSQCATGWQNIGSRPAWVAWVSVMVKITLQIFPCWHFPLIAWYTTVVCHLYHA